MRYPERVMDFLRAQGGGDKPPGWHEDEPQPPKPDPDNPDDHGEDES